MLDAQSLDGTQERPFLRAYHDIMDDLAATLSNAEFKVFYVLYRETDGYGRESKPLSESFLQKRTGIKSVKTLSKVLLSLAHKGLIRMWDVVQMGGTRIFALGEKLLHWIPLVKNTRGEAENAVVQRQLVQEEGVAEVIPLVKNTRGDGKKYQGEGQKIPGGVVKNTSDASSQPAPEAAPRVAKETLKESIKDTFKEKEFLKEEEKEEEKEDAPPPRAWEWQTVLEKIEPQVSHTTFLSWFRGSKAYKVGDQFIIEVESPFHKRYLHRYADLIHSILDPMLASSMEVFIATPDERRAACVPARSA